MRYNVQQLREDIREQQQKLVKLKAERPGSEADEGVAYNRLQITRLHIALAHLRGKIHTTVCNKHGYMLSDRRTGVLKADGTVSDVYPISAKRHASIAETALRNYRVTEVELPVGFVQEAALAC